MMLSLSRPYASRYGQPVVDRFDPMIFSYRYFGECMACTFCHDGCCQYGADTEMIRVNAILSRADELEQYLGVPRGEWFRLDPEDIGIVADEDYPGGEYTRTAVADLPLGRSPHNAEACVFLDREGRGCRLHRFGLERGIDVHEIKPMICLLFPISFQNGTLIPAIEFTLEDLVCQGPGPTLYQSARPDVLYYFGAELVAELDAFEKEHSAPEETATRGVALPLLS